MRPRPLQALPDAPAATAATHGGHPAARSGNEADAGLFIYPLFVCAGTGVRREVAQCPACINYPPTSCQGSSGGTSRRRAGVLLFGLPSNKDEIGSLAADPEAPVQTAVRALKRALPDLVVMTDVCLCEYTSHGHCGIVEGDEILNDATVAHLAQAALSHAVAGADFVAPSDMMDGRVAAIRRALDESGYDRVGIMSYAAKYCSGFYGPFRDAEDSAPQLGDRRTHHMDPANATKHSARGGD